ncbi:MAG: N-acetylmuramoyl-L-alanine amidase [Verrucomicrobiales bacterium]|nr:N-acetylmuramoyl-L-alanine amidase [Verrucomicrobiales bacterium]
MRRRGVLRGLGLTAAGVVLPVGDAAAAGSWEIVKVGGQDYITAKSVKAFYGFTDYVMGGKTVSFRSRTLKMLAQIGSQELIINGVKFILNNGVRRSGSQVLFSRLDVVKLIDPVLRPSYIRMGEPFTTVVIDPGHGGHDPGGHSVYGSEKKYNLELGLMMAGLLQQKGLRVVMTRKKDVYLTLGQRVAIGNKTPGSIFISLHHNSGPSSANGIETFAIAPQGASTTYANLKSSDGTAYQGNRRDSENIALATAVHASVMYTSGKVYVPKPVDRGVKRARYAVLRGITKPAVLLEGGFLTHRTEAKRIASKSYLRVLAQATTQAVLNYRKALTKR